MIDEKTWSARVRRGFWHYYLRSYPCAASAGIKASNSGDCRVPMTVAGNIILSINLGANSCSAFLRPVDGAPHQPVRALLQPSADFLVMCLGAAFEPKPDQGFLKTQLAMGGYDPDNWSDIAEWFETSRHRYRQAVEVVVGVE
ncbi:MAG: hypothetical protein K5872_13440 [Rhizobiaceae bacterium]|nr:hypothetical protein [Rhizobiaceae bacterium]MCV0407224.1 hypothetical protein [Rhizobiaceae bacterium]